MLVAARLGVGAIDLEVAGAGEARTEANRPAFPTANADLFGANALFAMPSASAAIQLPPTGAEKGDSSLFLALDIVAAFWRTG